MKIESISFSDLIEQYEIAIPMIQRDYAQGREDENAEKIRGKLLNKINFDDKKPIKFDFIYGYIEERDEREIFIPLDGQQRLTTLFLLHWYIAAKADKKDSTDKTNLKKFRYETRTSSTDFTQALVDNIDKLTLPSLLSAEKDKKSKKNLTALSEAIKNSAWFFTSWENDPTIAAMLVMLDAIHERNITKNKLEKITFDFINMGDFKLSDDLYLKMNARGVQLTPFENFKAFFEKHLEKIDDDMKNDEENSLKKRFSDSIDNTWLDIFWELKYADPDAIDKSYRTIDKPFMRFFWYMTEMLYFKKGIKYKNNQICDQNEKEAITNFEYDSDSIDEKLIEKVYGIDEVKYLLKVLDKFESIKELCDKVLSSEYEAGKVSLFTTESNLLEKLVKKGQLTNTERLILFTIINYTHKELDKIQHTYHLHDLVRIVRNLLKKGIDFDHPIKKERFYKATETIFYLTEKLKETNSDSIYKLLQSIVDEELSTYDNAPLNSTQKTFIQDEKKKAQLINKDSRFRKVIFDLEDDPRIKGAIHNFMPENDLNEISERFEQRKQAFNDIWLGNWSDIVRGLLSINDYSIWVGSSSLGGKYFFGKEGKDDSWISILTKNGNNDFLINFLDKHNNRYSNEDIRNEYLQNTQEKYWRYYFVKYPEMTCSEGYRNIFIFNNYIGFKIEDFKTGDRISNSNIHINPYVRTVIAKLKEKHGDDFIKHNIDKNKTEKGGDRANPLCLKSKMKLHCNREFKKEITLHCEEKGWKIEPALQPIKQEEKFNLIQDDGHFYLKPTEDKDMIEIAVEFISGLYTYVSGVPYDPSGLPVFPINPTV